MHQLGLSSRVAVFRLLVSAIMGNDLVTPVYVHSVSRYYSTLSMLQRLPRVPTLGTRLYDNSSRGRVKCPCQV